MEIFRFAILGAANIANKFCDAVARIPGCEVVAVASKSMERAKNFAERNKVPHVYADYGEMLDAEKPDCAYIAVTVNDHYRLTMLCVEKGIPVLCEKAMFENSREAEAAFARAKQARVFVMEAMWSRFLPAVKKVKEWVAGGRIGQVDLAQFDIGFVAPKGNENRYYSPALGGGVAKDITVYAYEMTTFLLGQKMNNMTAAASWSESGVDITNHIAISFEHTLASLMASFVSKMEERMVLYGREGKIILPSPHFGAECFLYDGEGALVEHFKDEETQNGFTYEIEEAMACVRAGKLESSVIPHADTIACAKMFDMIEATRSKRS
ncbi:MAG: Gfo/Idh/MocA family oxidoreductase [Lachnospiraceae bacterium]|nr:Gfo/Idh/MocA family oxidoreductase [Lachnospiraceae bacterium]